jgi:hypothetical protein
MTRVLAIAILSIAPMLGCGGADRNRSDSVAAPVDSASPTADSQAQRESLLPDTTGWSRHVSTRWGFALAYPRDALLRLEGPPDDSCTTRPDETATSTIEGTTADSARATRVELIALPLDSILAIHGFRRVKDGWIRTYGDEAAPEPAFSNGGLTVVSGSQMQRTFDRGEGATEQATYTVAVLRRPDGCAIVLSYSEVESRGAELRATEAFRTLTRFP